MLVGRVRFARYCGKMYCRHHFSYMVDWWPRRRGACAHYSQLNKYPTLPTPPLPTALTPKNIFSVLFLHIFLIISIIIRCSKMFGDVPCSWFYRRPTEVEIIVLINFPLPFLLFYRRLINTRLSLFTLKWQGKSLSKFKRVLFAGES